ncbi:MAG TPA: NUDIX domain-containing protein, partial [Phycisphaerales bacterium]|nr:NUDIX domain-containing protein [Phycisphaerales bacterium]
QVLRRKRPDKGLWAGLWAPPTIEDDRRAPGASALAALIGLKPRDANRPILAGSFTFTTTHRDVRFKVYAMTVPASTSINTAAQRAVWRRLSDDSHAAPGVSNAHRRVIEIAQQSLVATGRSTKA